ncbi:flagellin lysine-N-methylase [Butyrivibrio sp. MC2013]|uniref:flagellin lysine-N-methylase n=1 Tax=Butyrivibrio sp. MC2013 TaxID=1280686 RepID=UPI00040ABD7A|nr:flagellin lysine-N-methylase [Butyrivibrio sp. MC2013]
MKIYSNELYLEYKCLAGDCPETCCSGWRIIVDDETKERYMHKKGFGGFALRAGLSGPDDNYFNYDAGSCIFHDLKGLCRIQKKFGTEYMPEICRRFPREVRNYGSFAIENTDLSCIGQSLMLLKREKRPEMILRDGECEGAARGSNEDPQFARIILDSWKEFMDMTKLSPGDMTSYKALDLILKTMLFWCIYAQEAVLSHSEMKLVREENMPLAFYRKYAASDPDPDRLYLPMPIMALNRIINTDIDMEDERILSRINRAIEWYHRKYDLKTEIEGQRLWLKNVEEFFKEDPFRMEAILRYLLYYFQQCYPENYENYSFVHFAVTGIMHVNTVLFLWNNYARKKQLTVEVMADLITAYERGVCHNNAIQREMYDIVCDYLPIG